MNCAVNIYQVLYTPLQLHSSFRNRMLETIMRYILQVYYGQSDKVPSSVRNSDDVSPRPLTPECRCMMDFHALRSLIRVGFVASQD